MKNIALIDPSKNANDDFVANNIGDEIINKGINLNFFSEFENIEVLRFSSHKDLTLNEIDRANACEHVFFGGTNIVSMDICHESKWLPHREKFYYLNPKLKDLIYIGVGMNRYQTKRLNLICEWRTKLYYKNLLSKDFMHSVRDHQTLEALKGIGVKNVLFTSCPTLWGLKDDIDFNVNFKTKKCLFTLTDYDPNPIRDNDLINELLNHFDDLIFFPQGINDIDYINSLDTFTRNDDRIRILPRELKAVEIMAENEEFIYIGTRLHMGILLLNRGIKSLIIGIDNRAIEMKKSVNIPVILPAEFNLIERWINGERIFGPISLPFDSINKWKNQFK